MIQIIHGEIWSESFNELNNLIKDFQSCVRFAYNRFIKDCFGFSDVNRMTKIKYLSLNTRQVADAVLQGYTFKNVLLAQQKALAETKIEIENKLKKKLNDKRKVKLEEKLKQVKNRIKYPKLVFGGRKTWNDLKNGKITKKEWINHRDSQIYCRGDKNNIGNLNTRIIDDTLRITIGHKKWIYYKLFVPDKFRQELQNVLKSGKAYNIRLKRKDEQHFRVIIDYQIDNPIPNITFENGVIGVDTNPDKIALADVSADGNLVNTKTLPNTRILDAKTNKRDYDIGCLVKDTINYAKEKDKGIIFENLKFDKDKEGSKKWKRKQSNFVWKKFITLLEAKCIENGIQYTKVNPAYTSIIGKYKYRWMHKITIHESAAYVIGRRGLGYNEKLSFYKLPHERVKELVLGTLAGKYKNKRIHSWGLWKKLNDKIEAVLTELQVRLADLKEFVGNIWYRGEKLRGEIFLKELALGSNTGSSI